MTAGTPVPVSARRLHECLDSAAFWVVELPRYADRNQRNADIWALGAGVLAALTGLSIWPAAEATSPWGIKVLVAAAAFASAICALVPRIRNYAERAGEARGLASRYGNVVGMLTDLVETPNADHAAAAAAAVLEFGAIKEKKDALRGLPDRPNQEIRNQATQRRLLKGATETANARTAALEAARKTAETELLAVEAEAKAHAAHVALANLQATPPAEHPTAEPSKAEPGSAPGSDTH